MSRCLAISLLCLGTLYTLAQSPAERLKRLSDSLQRVNELKAEKIRQFKAARTNEWTSDLITDIRPDGHPVYRSILNANAAITTGAAKLQSGALGVNLSGKGITIGIWDDGKVADHVELGNRVISNEVNTPQLHMTHVAGTLIAAGINPAAKGMAPQAQVKAWYFDNDDAEIAAQARTDQTTLLISNHSYGQPTGWRKVNGAWVWEGDPAVNPDEDYNFGFYGARAQTIDQITHLAPYYTVVWAAGNDRAEVGNGSHPPDCNNGTGYDCIIPDATAKNIISVGAVDRVPVYTNPGSVTMTYFSSWGPTDDGRIKPDLVGDGVELLSLSSAGRDAYTTLSGTSMATPNVAGSLALLQELYAKLHSGNFMKAATLKAVAIHTARETGNYQGPDYNYGWGLLNVEAAAKVIVQEDGVNTFIEETTLVNGGKREWTLTPKANQKIMATIVWTDPAGVPVARRIDPTDIMLVNDLDIKITDEAGVEYLPWVLDPGNPAQRAQRGNNIRDNVERLEFDTPLAKTYKLTVDHKGTLSGGKQDFSVILTYQSINSTARIFYWIRDSGNWSDTTHWSFSSGGVSARQVPTVNDNVIVDENSFDGTGSDLITFSQDQSIASLKWLTVKPCGISLDNHKLTIGKNLALSSSLFNVSSAGEIILAGNGDGMLDFNTNDLSKVSLTINGGTWNATGRAYFNAINLSEGTLTMSNMTLKVNTLASNSTKMRALNATSSSIELVQGSTMTSDNLSINAQGSTLLINSNPVMLDWNGVVWDGSLVINKSNGMIKGANQFAKMEVTGQLEFSGSNKMDSLVVNPGSEIRFASNTEQTIVEPLFTATPLAPIKFSGNTSASLTLTHHKKYCFDYLQVVDLELKGMAVVNAGLNGLLTNAQGWLSQKCEEVLYANFNVTFPCEQALVRFDDKSTGTISQWTWTFPGGQSVTGKQAEFPFMQAGKYPVTLMVSDGTVSNTYSTEITIGSNTLPANQVVANNAELFSLNQGIAYRWFKDNAQISGAIKRSYAHQGQEGVYYVVNYNETCNRMSAPITITGVGDMTTSISRLYPNPADDHFVVDNTKREAMTVILMDSFGRVLSTAGSVENPITVSTSHLAEGVYLVEISKGDHKFRDKVVVVHK